MAARSVQYLRSLLCCLRDFVSVWAHPFQIPAYLVLHNTQERVVKSGDPDPLAFLPSQGTVRSLQAFHHSEPCSQWPCSRSQRCFWQEWKSHLVQPTHLLLLIQAVLLLCVGRFVSTSIRLVFCGCESSTLKEPGAALLLLPYCRIPYHIHPRPHVRHLPVWDCRAEQRQPNTQHQDQAWGILLESSETGPRDRNKIHGCEHCSIMLPSGIPQSSCGGALSRPCGCCPRSQGRTGHNSALCLHQKPQPCRLWRVLGRWLPPLWVPGVIPLSSPQGTVTSHPREALCFRHRARKMGKRSKALQRHSYIDNTVSLEKLGSIRNCARVCFKTNPQIHRVAIHNDCVRIRHKFSYLTL